MSLFYLWNPSINTERPEVLDLVLTRGDSYGLNKGTASFLGSVVAALGIQADIVRWSITTCRSQYFSDFIGEDDWRDNWQLVWKLSMTARKNIGEITPTAEPWVGLDVLDDTWKIAPDDHSAAVEGLVIADFRTVAAREKARATIARHAGIERFRERLGLAAPTFSTGMAYGKYPQLLIQLGQLPGAFFADGADYAESVTEVCTKAKGSVHYSGFLGA
jgi:hypothetical protein